MKPISQTRPLGHKVKQSAQGQAGGGRLSTPRSCKVHSRSFQGLLTLTQQFPVWKSVHRKELRMVNRCRTSVFITGLFLAVKNGN